MTKYRVQWDIDVDADSPADAAVQARRLCVNQEPEYRFAVAVLAVASESGGIDDGAIFTRIAELEVQADPSHPFYRVGLAMDLWPNAHLGDNTRREDMNSAFKMIRSYVAAGHSISAAAGAVENDAYRHEDM